jgi:hypothetical protein
MDVKPLPPGLHAILGDHAADNFIQVFPDHSSLIIDRDVLSCGPTPACDSLDSWQSMRFAFWNSAAPPDPENHRRDYMGLHSRAKRLREAERITLWVGTGLSEQLSAAATIHFAEDGRPAAGKFWIVPFEVYGLGILDGAAMAAHPEPRELSPAELQHFRDLWAALTSPDPALVERFAESHPDANPNLKRASRLLMRRFPDRKSGLNYWDHALLAGCTTRRQKAARIIGETISNHRAECDPVGDLFLFKRLMALGSPNLPQPLIEIFGIGTRMRDTEVKLTPFGLDVLEGRASNYPTNPIDDWAAGVRLSSRDGALWFNDNGKLVRES